jgi:hypothetical protein
LRFLKTEIFFARGLATSGKSVIGDLTVLPGALLTMNLTAVTKAR